MDWKKKLMVATAAFASMPATVMAHPELINSIRAGRTGRLRRRATSVPFVVDPSTDQKIRVSVRVPNSARRISKRKPVNEKRATNLKRCDIYDVKSMYMKMEVSGLRRVMPAKSNRISAGGGTTFEFDLSDLGLQKSTTVIARVEVTAADKEKCISAAPLSSFSLKALDGNSKFLPSRDLSPVLLKSKFDGPIIKE